MNKIEADSTRNEVKSIRTLGFLIFLIIMTTGSLRAQYTETYRPQFHFSPSSGWIGDPDGTVRYNNKYHLFWWGHAISNDLVYWTEKSWPMQGDNSTFDYFSGSVVVDSKNTAGFNTGSNAPMVAIYTMNNKATGYQTQGLSYSNDFITDYTNFTQYTSNPVLGIGSKAFRDPSVFWDAINNQWIMAIAESDNKKVDFYYSTNLKTWRILNSFGPLGAKESAWECPDLVQLPVDGNMNNKKWVLICGVGPNKIQYFLGDFDGYYGFDIDPACDSYLRQGVGIVGDVISDFETTTYSGWTTEGTAFGAGPASGSLSGQMSVGGYLGNRLCNSYNGGDGTIGKLTSSVFTISKNCINFLIGGGNNPGGTCINLVVDGTVVQSTTGANTETLKWAGWNVSQWKGKQAYIEIVDNSTGSWGHITIDNIMSSDVLLNYNREHALFADFGSDFYAARTYRDYDNVENRTVWLGWMGNWDYANSTPTSWGRGHESIPREIALKTFADGIRLVQKPIPALQKLRNDSVIISNRTFQDTQTLTEFIPKVNCYEIDAVFNITAGANFGMNLCVEGTNKVVLGYDATTSNIYLDRRNSGNVSFSSSFPNIVSAPLLPDNGQIKLHVYVDQSSVEVFANDGVKVISSLIFPEPSSKGIQFFSTNGQTTVESFKAYNLKSIWTTSPTAMNEVYIPGNNGIELYPNPLKAGQDLRLILTNNLMNVSNLDVKIYTIQGKKITEEKNLTLNGNSFRYPNNLIPGVYIVNVETKEFTETSKLIVQ